jgi:hypothetical protein
MIKKKVTTSEIRMGDIVNILGHKCTCTRVLDMTYYMNLEFESKTKSFQTEIRCPRNQIFTILIDPVTE